MRKHIRILGWVLACGVFAASPAPAADGRWPISSACASVGCFPDDAPGYPVTISAAGSYVLTSDLAPSEDTSGVRIETSFVTLNLGGFEIRNDSPIGTTTSGVVIDDMFSRVGIEVRNGHVAGMSNVCVQAGVASIVRDILAEACLNNGVMAAPGSVLRNNQAAGNGASGVFGNSDSVIRGNIASQNGLDGIIVFAGSVVEGNSSTANTDSGVRVFSGSMLAGNTAAENNENGIEANGADGVLIETSTADSNGSWGIECRFGCNLRENTSHKNSRGIILGSSSGYSHNVIVDNLNDAVLGGASRSDNHCAGVGASSPSCP